jgi:hypothetical protein
MSEVNYGLFRRAYEAIRMYESTAERLPVELTYVEISALEDE